jgi:hypothetical protein
MKLSTGPFNLSFIKRFNNLPAFYVVIVLAVKFIEPLFHLYGNSTIEHAYLFLAIFLNVLAKALALPVQPGLVIGVHLPFVPLLSIEAVAFCIQFLSDFLVAIIISF